jgi:outer membrane protein OmpA-like peptidoglycan-associated protein
MNSLFLFLLFEFLGFISFAQTDTLSIFFEVDSDEVSNDQKALLQELSATDLIVIVEGHCDTTGSIAYNQRLAERRVNRVAHLMGSTPISRLQAVGEKIAAQSKSYKAEKFRRVDVVFSKMEEEQLAIADAPRVVEESPEVSKMVQSFERFLTDPEKKDEVIQLSILFHSNSGAYVQESEAELWALFDFLHYNPDIDIHIRGHICCVKFMDWDDISEKRARTVYDFLKDRSIDPSRMTFAGYGTSIPFKSPEITKEDQRLNRRVDIVFSKTK